jgi:phosphate transport system protein
MENHLATGLGELKTRLLAMASLAETSVINSVQALLLRNTELAEHVRVQDQNINFLEMEIDELALHLLSRAPLAGDLRFVTTACRISQNLERIGDESKKIAKRARDLAREPALHLELDLSRMARLALDMLKESLDCFVQRNATAARAIIPRDAEVDAINHRLHDEMVIYMMEHSDTIARCLDWIVAAKSLERIADHAKNIAEDVVYLCEAENIRHRARRIAAAA